MCIPPFHCFLFLNVYHRAQQHANHLLTTQLLPAVRCVFFHLNVSLCSNLAMCCYLYCSYSTDTHIYHATQPPSVSLSLSLSLPHTLILIYHRSSSAFVEFVVEEGLSNQCIPLQVSECMSAVIVRAIPDVADLS